MDSKAVGGIALFVIIFLILFAIFTGARPSKVTVPGGGGAEFVYPDKPGPSSQTSSGSGATLSGNAERPSTSAPPPSNVVTPSVLSQRSTKETEQTVAKREWLRRIYAPATYQYRFRLGQTPRADLVTAQITEVIESAPKDDRVSLHTTLRNLTVHDAGQEEVVLTFAKWDELLDLRGNEVQMSIREASKENNSDPSSFFASALTLFFLRHLPLSDKAVQPGDEWNCDFPRLVGLSDVNGNERPRGSATLVGRETINGRSAWKVRFAASGMAATYWLDATDCQVVKMDGELVGKDETLYFSIQRKAAD